MSRPVLLDVNALIALFDSAHVHHSAAHHWFAKARASGWRTCPITESGLLRILSNPGYPNGPLPILDLAGRLEEFKRSSSDHEFWADNFSIASWVHQNGLNILSSQLTDAYLLNLAVRQNGALATFDLRIEPALVGKTTPDNLEYIPIAL